MFPNDFIINTNFATLKNDAKGDISIVIPESFTVDIGSVPLSQEINLGTLSAGMHTTFTSSKYPNVGLVASQVSVPCQITYQSASGGQVTRLSSLNCYIYRSGVGTVRMEISPSIPGDIASSAATIAGAGQIVTCHVLTMINPFEA